MRVVQPVLITLFLLQSFPIFSQKKPLDHTVYDGWQNIGERGISNKGEWVFFAVNPQEGDGVLYIKDSSGKSIIALPRGYNAAFAPGENFLLCKIRAPFAATREAKIKKKKPEEMPKDSLAIVNLASREIKKIAAVKQYALPETTTNSWLVYWLEKQTATKEIKATPDSLTTLNELLRSADSLTRVSDSLRKKATELTSRGMSALQPPAIKKSMASPSPTNAATDTEEGSDLILYNLANGKEYKYAQVTEWIFSKFGHTLVYEQSKKADNSKGKNTVHLVQTASATDQTILAGFYDAKAYVLDEAGQQLAFVAERDSGNKAVQRFYQLWYFKAGGDSAQLLAHQKSPGLPAGYTIAESNGNRADMGFRRAGSEQLFFSQSGQRLFVGLSSIIPPKDTSLPDFERVNLDIWHYNDDQIQPAQLRSLNADINRSYLARYDFTNQQIVPLGNKALRTVWSTREGDGKHFYASSDTGKRIAAQWQGFTLSDLYQLQPDNGTTTLIKKDVKANLITTSPGGDYLVWYDEQQKTYFSYHAPQKRMTAFAKDIPYPLYDEENDVPDDANAEGLVKWTEDERFIFLYDRYDIWKVDPTGKEKSVRITQGRNNQLQYRFINTDRDEKFFTSKSNLLLRVFDEKDKSSGLALLQLENNQLTSLFKEPVWVGPAVAKAKESAVFLYTKESFQQSPNVFIKEITSAQRQLSAINPQQTAFSWGSASLFKWKAYSGRMTEGVLYRPENFDATKKYPMIVYFYERNNQTLHNYLPPSPTPSRLNIPFYVSRGYVVFVPDIWYNKGYPGQGAYDYILSGTRAVVKEGYVDSTRLGLQGQSWGGYQIAYLITKTPLYKAAWAGAPVANMTSAYGGIRWGPGILRQFQYEKSQSRIGATLWEKPELYIKNSPLFSLPAVKTPLVIMSNDADDAVPWYQGIELYAGLRRLGKPVWLLNYNNEVHNLAERKNRKDIQIRQQQFFDYLLKDAAPAKWIKEGVPAIMKGRDSGLGY
jgi:dipeptidyl aminopeptidase/acylaminoacyl peptidase